MAVVRVLVVAAALLALASLPCVVAMSIVHADELLERVGGLAQRCLRRCRALLVDYRVLHERVVEPPVPATPAGPPIEQIAADLRRLGRQRTGIATRSPVWFAAVQRAYEERLVQACRSLGVVQHLDELTGLDREIERVRVEGELQAAGLVLGPVDAEHA
ncbi:MAG TPA: hypothetical protein VFM55_12640 [Micromonosporaceae bacterium]|nr:hypothetical protein [Micromonosporaceae bacterium]